MNFNKSDKLFIWYIYMLYKDNKMWHVLRLFLMDKEDGKLLKGKFKYKL